MWQAQLPISGWRRASGAYELPIEDSARAISAGQQQTQVWLIAQPPVP